MDEVLAAAGADLIETNTISLLETNPQFIEAYMAGDFRSEERYFESVRSATPDDLRRVATQYLAPEKLTACALLPEAEASGEAAPLDDASLAAAIEAGVASVMTAHVSIPALDSVRPL